MCQKRNRILILFCSDFRRKLYLREISKLSKIPLKTTSRIMKDLEEKNIIRYNLEGKHKYFELNLDNIETKFLLIEAEISKMFSFLKKYPIFNSFLKHITLVNGIICVFGSFSELKATKDSDLDILIVSDKKIELPKHLLPYKTNEIHLNRKEFLSALSKGEPLVREILANHTILHNHSSFIDILWWYYGKKS
ncbi:MAG: nucleotidyltransferase domain-containing protein [Candidatus Aenigmatarchaeota archaeon]